MFCAIPFSLKNLKLMNSLDSQLSILPFTDQWQPNLSKKSNGKQMSVLILAMILSNDMMKMKACQRHPRNGEGTLYRKSLQHKFVNLTPCKREEAN